MTGDLSAVAGEVIKREVEGWAQAKGKAPSLDEHVLARQAEATAKILEVFYANSGGRLVFLEGPTGSGKTEVFSALFFAQWRLGRWHSGRLFVVEPVHALLRQMRRRLGVYGELFGVGVGEDHGEVAKPTYLYTAPATLTTVDSYVYGYLAKRVDTWLEGRAETGRYTLPVGVMMNSFSVFDEAHVIQDEVFLGPRVLADVACFLVKAGAYVAVSTATLPTAFRKLFEERCGERIISVQLPGRKRELAVEIREKELTGDDVECEGGTLVVVNTVRRAREMYKSLRERCGRRVRVVHSLMKRGDRDGVVDELASLEERGGLEEVILVGTQAVEVGLDFSFRRLYTDLAPLDALIQRIGRVGRGGQRAEAYVYTKVEPRPYIDIVMKRTAEVVRRTSILVEGLGEVDKTRELLDVVYDDGLVEELSKRGDEFYLETVDYFYKLHLFALPPEEEPFIRPSFYIDVYLLEKGDVKAVGEEQAEAKLDLLYKSRVRISAKFGEESRVERVWQLLDRCKKYRIKDVGEDIAHLELLEAVGQAESAVHRLGHVVTVCDNLAEVYDEAGLRVEGAGDSARPSKGRRRGSRGGV